MWGRMPLGCVIQIRHVAAFGLALLIGVQPVQSREASLCYDAARLAAARNNIPFAVLWGITQTETGRNESGVVEPWPWTLNIHGQGYWLNSRDAARRRATQSIALGHDSVDLGCFQINYRWHHQHFTSVDEMLDPDAGATYAAKFLKSLFAEKGNWSEAAGAYHSRTPRHAARYRERFDRFYARATAKTNQSALRPARQNSFPLLRQGSGQTALGSLVPFAESDS